MEGLFSVLVTMGVVPIIRCPKVRGKTLCKCDTSPVLPIASHTFSLLNHKACLR